MKHIQQYQNFNNPIESVNEAVPSTEDYHSKNRLDVLFTIEGPHKKALATSKAIWKDVYAKGMVFDEFFDNDKGNESGEFLISFPASVNNVQGAGKKEIIKLVGNRGTLVERPNWVNESVNEAESVNLEDLEYQIPLSIEKVFGTSPKAFKGIKRKYKDIRAVFSSYIDTPKIEKLLKDINQTLNTDLKIKEGPNRNRTGNVFTLSESLNEAKRYEWDDLLDVLMTIGGTGKILNRINMKDPEVEELLDSKYKSYPDFAKAVKSMYNIKESVNELKAAPRSDKAIKDLEKQGSEINYLDDADPATKKLWKKAGINPDDQNTIILYSYVAHPWEDIKNILTKHSIDFKELEDPNSAGESMIVFIEESVNEGVIGIKTEGGFKPKDLSDALDKAKVKYKMNRLSTTLTVLNLDKNYFEDAKKIVDDLGLNIMMAKESVNESDNWKTVKNKSGDTLKPGKKYKMPRYDGEITFIRFDRDNKTLHLKSNKIGKIRTSIDNVKDMELIESTHKYIKTFEVATQVPAKMVGMDILGDDEDEDEKKKKMPGPMGMVSYLGVAEEEEEEELKKQGRIPGPKGGVGYAGKERD